MEVIFINYAGLVITAPYLNTLFIKLDYLSEGKFKSTEQRDRAVQLLSYLAIGVEVENEHEMVLQKLLCGLQMTDAVDTSILLTSSEKDTADSLLSAITQKWSSLNNSSIEALRESFLKRDGVVEEEQDSYLVQVEAKTFDVLLDTIPWTFSKIKMNWMEKLINVTWRNV